MNNLPKELSKYLNHHCTECGNKLIFKEKKLNGYDDDTGKPEYEYIFSCPNKQWLNFFKLHTKKGYLVCEGWRLKKTGDRTVLITQFF